MLSGKELWKSKLSLLWQGEDRDNMFFKKTYKNLIKDRAEQSGVFLLIL